MNSLVFTFLVASVFVAAATAETKECWMKRFGELTMFNGKSYNVELPCKYLLADFRCNGYRVKVKVSNRLKDGRFSPTFVNVNVIRIDGKATFSTRTSGPLLNKFNNNQVAEPWTDTTGDNTIVSYIGNHGLNAVVRVQGGALVKYGDVMGVKVACDKADLTNGKEFQDDTLCGGRNTPGDTMQQYKTSNQLTSFTIGQTMHYLVLGGMNASSQNKECIPVAQEFQSCPTNLKKAAVQACEAIFGKRPLVACLATEAPSTYKNCLKYVCAQTGANPKSVIKAKCRGLY